MGMLAWDILFLIAVVAIYTWATYRVVVTAKMKVDDHIKVGSGRIVQTDKGFVVEVPYEIPSGSVFQDGLYTLNFTQSRLGVRVKCLPATDPSEQRVVRAQFARRIDAEEVDAILHRKYFWAHLIEQRRTRSEQTG